MACGANNFSLVINTVKAAQNCNITASGHNHIEESCLFDLSGSGGISVDGTVYEIEPNTAVFIPAESMHFVWANEGEDFTYIIVYFPPGLEKEI